MKSFKQALKENAKKQVVFIPEPKPQEDIDYEEALKMYGLTKVTELKLDELDDAYLFYRQKYFDNEIDKRIFRDICEEILYHGLGNVIQKCKYGS